MSTLPWLNPTSEAGQDKSRQAGSEKRGVGLKPTDKTETAEARQQGLKPEIVLQSGHVEGAWAVAFSADGRWVASGGKDNRLKIWDAKTGLELRTLTSEPEWIESITFHPQGRWLAAGGRNGVIRVWEVGTWRETHTLRGHRKVLSFSPDGRFLALMQAESIKLCESGTWTEKRVLAGLPDASVLAFSTDSKLIALANYSKIKILEVASGNEVRVLSYGGNAVAFSPNGRLLAVGNSAFAKYAVDIWDLQSGQKLHTLEGHSWAVWGVDFSRDGRLLVSGGGKTIKIWDVSTARELHTIQGHDDFIEAIAISPDSTMFASAARDSAVKLWDIATGRQIHSMSGRAASVSALAFSSNGRWIATGSGRKFEAGDTAVRVWEVGSGQVLHRLIPPGVYGVQTIEFNAGNGQVASDGDQETVKVWDAASGKELHTLGGKFRGNIFGLAYSPDGRLLASAGEYSGVAVYDAVSGSEVQRWKHRAKSLAFSPDNRWIALGLLQQIKLVEVATGAELRTLAPHSSLVEALAVSPDGRLLASQSFGDKVKLWDVNNGREVMVLEEGANALAFSPDGRLLATARKLSAEAKLWDVKSGRMTLTLSGHTDEVRDVAFSPDGRLLMSGSMDGSVRLWEVATGEPLALITLMRGTGDWTVVTPEGFFDGSLLGMQKLVAWRFEGNQTAPLEIFFNELYYPGLLADLMAGKRPKPPRNISQLDRRQPHLKLRSAESQAAPDALASRVVKVIVEVSEAPADAQRGGGSGARDLRLFRNGSLVKVWRGDVLNRKNGASLEVTVPIIAGENRFTAYAFNRDNIKSSDATLVVRGAESLRRKGVAYILAVGVNEYANAEYNLNFAVADAQAFGDEMKRQQAKLTQFERIEIVRLHDKAATKAAILKSIADLWGKTEPEDAVMIFFAGHGTAQGNRFYLIPHDLGYLGSRTTLGAAGLQTILAHSISDEELEHAVEGIDAGHLLMVIDACNSGQALEAEEKRRGPMNSKGLAQLAYEKGMYILTAAQSYQAALEAAKLGHGYLTFALVEEGLKTSVSDRAPPDGQVLVREWLDFATARVPEMQLEKIEEQRKLGRGVGLVIKFVESDIGEDRNVQRPRVFYRREAESSPLIVAKP
ncbi:MAG: caspase family protein [Acidobacteriota bacterium]